MDAICKPDNFVVSIWVLVKLIAGENLISSVKLLTVIISLLLISKGGF
jgi:hypothetical protein